MVVRLAVVVVVRLEVAHERHNSAVVVAEYTLERLKRYFGYSPAFCQ